MIIIMVCFTSVFYVFVAAILLWTNKTYVLSSSLFHLFSKHIWVFEQCFNLILISFLIQKSSSELDVVSVLESDLPPSVFSFVSHLFVSLYYRSATAQLRGGWWCVVMVHWRETAFSASWAMTTDVTGTTVPRWKASLTTRRRERRTSTLTSARSVCCCLWWSHLLWQHTVAWNTRK